jgi:hypothetical protein
VQLVPQVLLDGAGRDGPALRERGSVLGQLNGLSLCRGQVDLANYAKKLREGRGLVTGCQGLVSVRADARAGQALPLVNVLVEVVLVVPDADRERDQEEQ